MTGTSMRVRVAIVEDDAPYRAALRDLFSIDPGFAVEGSYDSAVALLGVVRARSEVGKPAPWDLVLMDIELPSIDGIEATARLLATWPGVSVVMLTSFEDPQRILGAICAGACGYLLKKTEPGEVLEEVRAIVRGGSPLTPSVARSILGVLRNGAPAPTARDGQWDLTDREMDVLRSLVQGHAYKEVASTLHMSLDTVRTHVRSIYKKMQVHSVSQAVARAIRAGIV
jgi:DNA-binding NarL/FixJ family response regulator